MTLAWALILTVVMVLLYKEGKLGKAIRITAIIGAVVIVAYGILFTWSTISYEQKQTGTPSDSALPAGYTFQAPTQCMTNSVSDK